MTKNIGNTIREYTLQLILLFLLTLHIQIVIKQLNIFMVAEEKRQGGGGEFDITLWQHTTTPPKVENMNIEEDGEFYTYNINYPESIQLEYFSYMDFFR